MADIDDEDDKVFKISDLLKSNNIAEMLDEEELDEIGERAVRLYHMDKDSRVDWEKKMEDSLKLALQVVEAKSFPWPNASNIKFPLITIAALQYHARAYPALIPGTSVVQCRLFGEDPDNSLAARSNRIGTHMSYQVLEEDENWEDQMDKVLITQPIIGCAFKKTFYDSYKKHNVSENIFAKDLVVDYYTKSLDDAQRITHVLYLSKNDIYERIARGDYLDVELGDEGSTTQGSMDLAKDKRQGVTPPQQDENKPYEILEQHCWIDFDGDGYQEPYIVLVHKESQKVLRIVARYFPSSIELDKKMNVLKIKAENYFTKYPFIPSPDGGFYDLGFGTLLGPLNESINTIVNQLVDAGTLSNTGGGFLSRGVKFRGGNSSFTPGEWKPVDSTGDDLSKGIVPLPIREPSQVLFTLLSLLIDYGERIGGSVDILTGQNPGQNTPAETSRNMTEQGLKIFSGIFKRTYRSLKEEFRKLYRLNQLYLDEDSDIPKGMVAPEDYQGDSKSIRPAADPNMISDNQRVSQASSLLQMATSGGGFNVYEAQRRMLVALRVEDIEKVLPDPKGPNAIPVPPHYKVQEAQVKAEAKMADAELKFKLAIMAMLQESEVNQGKIAKLEAESILLKTQAESLTNNHEIAQKQFQLDAAKSHHEGILKSVSIMQKAYSDAVKMETPTAASTIAGQQ
jgi:chaperonin GroES